jgi:hypothetical protein
LVGKVPNSPRVPRAAGRARLRVCAHGVHRRARAPPPGGRPRCGAEFGRIKGIGLENPVFAAAVARSPALAALDDEKEGGGGKLAFTFD